MCAQAATRRSQAATLCTQAATLCTQAAALCIARFIERAAAAARAAAAPTGRDRTGRRQGGPTNSLGLDGKAWAWPWNPGGCNPKWQRLQPKASPNPSPASNPHQAWKWLEGDARDIDLESTAVRTGAAFQAGIPPFAPCCPEEYEDRGDELQVIEFTPCAAPPPLPPRRAATPSPDTSIGYHGAVGQGGRGRRPSHEEREERPPPTSREEEEAHEGGRRYSSQFRGVSRRHGRWKVRSHYAAHVHVEDMPQGQWHQHRAYTMNSPRAHRAYTAHTPCMHHAYTEQARIKVKGADTVIGTYDNDLAAALAYDKRARQLHG